MFFFGIHFGDTQPQHDTVPVARAAHAWRIPTAIDTASVIPATGLGEVVEAVPATPSPSISYESLPQHDTDPVV